ncbi:hypothetical protein GCM10022205_40520 [Spinactinospora alkalitolerans]
MAGDPQGMPEYTWELVDSETGEKIDIPERTSMTMPDLSGKRGDLAVTMLQDAGYAGTTSELRFANIDPSEDGSVWMRANWVVVEQSVPAGEEIEVDADITLGVVRPLL